MITIVSADAINNNNSSNSLRGTRMGVVGRARPPSEPHRPAADGRPSEDDIFDNDKHKS